MADQVLITVRNKVSGELLVGPETFSRLSAIRDVRSRLQGERLGHRGILSNRAKIFSDEVELQDCSPLVEEVMEFTAVYWSEALSQSERGKYIESLSDPSCKFRNFPEAALADREVVLAALERESFNLMFADHALQEDREFILEAVQMTPEALIFAGSKFQDDRSVVLTAVQQDPEVLHCVGPMCSDDRDIVSMAVLRKPEMLQHAGSACKDDRDIVLTAVRENPKVLQHAGPLCKGDRDIVLTAVRQDPRLLEYAGTGCNDDREIWSVILKAIHKDPCSRLTPAQKDLTKKSLNLLPCSLEDWSVVFMNGVAIGKALDGDPKALLALFKKRITEHGVSIGYHGMGHNKAKMAEVILKLVHNFDPLALELLTYLLESYRGVDVDTARVIGEVAREDDENAVEALMHSIRKNSYKVPDAVMYAFEHFTSPSKRTHIVWREIMRFSTAEDSEPFKGQSSTRSDFEAFLQRYPVLFHI